MMQANDFDGSKAFISRLANEFVQRVTSYGYGVSITLVPNVEDNNDWHFGSDRARDIVVVAGKMLKGDWKGAVVGMSKIAGFDSPKEFCMYYASQLDDPENKFKEWIEDQEDLF